MKVVIRVDASVTIGTGHVMRCLSLADRLRDKGAVVRFICREAAGNLCEFIESRGYEVARLGVLGDETSGAARREAWRKDAAGSAAALRSWHEPADLLVVDHYELAAEWELAMRSCSTRIFVLDDLANRRHECDVLLDQNLHDAPLLRYVGRVPASARVFVGPRYALLRPEFEGLQPVPRVEGVRSLLVFFGGADPSNEALKVIAALRSLSDATPACTLIVGPINPAAALIRRTAQGIRGLRIIDVSNEMARLMMQADLGIGTCGGSAWERCATGLPALVIVSAENQRDDARILNELGAVQNLGEGGEITAERWAAAIVSLSADRARLTSMSRAAAAVMHDRAGAMLELEAALVH